MSAKLAWLIAAAATGGYLLVDARPVKAALVVAVAAGSTVAVLLGVRRHRPACAAPWLLVAGAQGVWAVSWVFWELPILKDGQSPGSGSTINLLFVAGNLLVAGSLVLLLRLRERDLVGVVDAATIASAIGVVAWAALLHRYVGGDGTVLERTVPIAYGIADVLLLALVVRVGVTAVRRSSSFLFLLASPLALVASDAVWNWFSVLGDYVLGSAADLGWLLFSVFAGAAALQPSMRTVFVPADRPVRRLRLDRILMLVGAILVVPIVYLVEEAAHTVNAEPLIGAAVFIGLLVVVRLALVAKAEGAISDRLGEIAAIVESTDDAVVGTDLRGTVTNWNHGAELLYGYAAAEIIGRSVMRIVPPEAVSRAEETFVLIGAGDSIPRHEAVGIHRDGRRVDVALTVSPIRTADGKVVGTSTIARDISERLAHEQERERLVAELEGRNEQLLQLDRLKDDFVASVSHELRTPLTSISGYLELVRDDGHVDEEAARLLGIVDRNAERLLRLVSDLLFVAQVDAGRLAIEVLDVDLATLVDEAVEAARPRARAGGVALTSAPVPVTVVGDESRLAQVLDNLISNAIKFTPAGGRVHVALSRSETTVRIEVSDTGMGIPAAEQEHLFERFFRTSGATRRAVQGTGLGLTIVKAIVESHGGSVAVGSREGAGTTFVVELPLAAVPAVA